MSKIDSNYAQNSSDSILSDGCYKLKFQTYFDFSSVKEKGYGNYLISNNKIPCYVGEAKDILSRVKQQSKEKTSTFYKTYLDRNGKNGLAIDDFKIQIIRTDIGRKEIEDFGIVNFPTELNKFQIGKRKLFGIKNQNGIWNEVQDNFEEILQQGKEAILNREFLGWKNLEIDCKAGIYLIKDKKEKLIYVGESSNLKERIVESHSGRTYISAFRRHLGTEILGYKLQ